MIPAFTASDTSTAVVLDLGTSNVTYNIDDIVLLEGDTPSENPCPRAGVGNLLYNGNLEFGEDDEFYGCGKWNGEDVMTATTEEVYSGARALQAVSAGGNHWDVQLGSNHIPTVVDTSYTASMWIKGAADGGVVRFSTNAGAGAQYQGDQTIGTEWQQVTWTFTANDTSTALVLDMGVSAATYYIDDISLVVAEE